MKEADIIKYLKELKKKKKDIFICKGLEQYIRLLYQG